MAISPEFNNSLLTLGPTFSTLLKFIVDPRSADNLSFIDFINYVSLILVVSILRR